MAFATRLVRFVKDHRSDGGGVKGEAGEFKAAETHELPEPSALHYVRQGRAVWAEDAAAKAPSAGPPAPVEKGMKPGQVRTKPAKKPGAATARRIEPAPAGSPTVAAEGKSSPHRKSGPPAGP